MASLNIAIRIAAQDKASGPIGRIKGALGGLSGAAKSGFAGLGNIITTGIVGAAGLGVAAIGAIGTAVFGVANDVQVATSNIKAQLGTTTEEAARLGGIAKEVWGNNFAGSIPEAANAIGLVRQQLGDLADGELKDAAQNAFRLQDSFEVGVVESIDAADTLMEQFGLTSDQAFDFIAKGFQSGLDRSGDFLDTIGEYSTQFASGGADAGQFFSLLESGLQGGMLGTDKAADAFKEFRVRIQDGSSATADALGLLGISSDELTEGMADGSITAADAFSLVVDALNEVDDENVRIQAGVGLLGTQFEDLGTEGALALSLIGTDLDDMAGATDTLDAKYDNLGDRVEGWKRRSLVAIEPIGSALLGLADRVLPAVESGFEFLETTVVPVLETAVGVVSSFIGNLEEGMGPLDAFVEAIWDIAPPGVLSALTNLRDNILPGLATWFVTNVTPILDMVAGFVGWQDVLVAVGIVVAGTVVPALIGIAVAAAPVIAVAALLIGGIALLRTAWETDFAGIRDFVGGVWSGIQQGFGAFKALFAGDFEGFTTGIKSAWETGWNATIAFLGNLWGLASPYLEEWYASALAWFQGVDWVGLAQIVMGFIVTKLGEFWSLTVSTIEEWLSSFTGWVEAQDWQQMGFTVTTNIIAALKEFWATAVPTVQGWWESFQTWFGGIDWGELGRGIIDGIVMGLQNAGSAVVAALSDIISGAVAAIMAEWEYGSPSRRMARVVGMPLGQGVAVGWTAALDEAEFAAPLERALTLPSASSPQLRRSGQPAFGGDGGVMIVFQSGSIQVAGGRGSGVERSLKAVVKTAVAEALGKSGRRADVLIRNRG